MECGITDVSNPIQKFNFETISTSGKSSWSTGSRAVNITSTVIVKARIDGNVSICPKVMAHIDSSSTSGGSNTSSVSYTCSIFPTVVLKINFE